MGDRALIDQAKARLRIPDLWGRLGFPGQPPKPGAVVRSPLRQEKTASWSISKDGRLWFDHGAGVGGDAVTLVEQALGVSDADAIRTLVDWAGLTPLPGPRPVAARPAPRVEPVPRLTPRARPQLPALSRPAPSQLEQLSRVRGISVPALEAAVARGILWAAEVHQRPAWVLTDAQQVNAQARRWDGEKWPTQGGGVKALTLPGSWARWPVGAAGLEAPEVWLVEGGPDLLAAMDIARLVNRPIDCCAMFGAGMDLHPAALPLFAGRIVRIWRQGDVAGAAGAERWAKQLRTVATVTIEVMPPGIKDVNDWLRAGVDCSSLPE